MTLREPWKPRVLRRFGRLLAAGFVLVYTALVVREVSGEFNARGAALIALLVYVVLAAFVSWLSDRVGGAMLVIGGIALASFMAVVAERNQVGATVLIGGSFLLAGLALLLAAGLHDEGLQGLEDTDSEELIAGNQQGSEFDTRWRRSYHAVPSRWWLRRSTRVPFRRRTRPVRWRPTLGAVALLRVLLLAACTKGGG